MRKTLGNNFDGKLTTVRNALASTANGEGATAEKALLGSVQPIFAKKCGILGGQEAHGLVKAFLANY